MYSDTQLGCRGHACAKCGYCRDWYWRPDPNGQGLKIYTKRPNASCIYNYARLLGDRALNRLLNNRNLRARDRALNRLLNNRNLNRARDRALNRLLNNRNLHDDLNLDNNDNLRLNNRNLHDDLDNLLNRYHFLLNYNLLDDDLARRLCECEDNQS